MQANEDTGSPRWSVAIDSLAFQPADHNGSCVIHRRAFATLLRCSASPEQCLAFFSEHRVTFEKAAAAKITAAALRIDANFHLTSRDIARAR